jgi:hypothetical protein
MSHFLKSGILLGILVISSSCQGSDSVKPIASNNPTATNLPTPSENVPTSPDSIISPLPTVLPNNPNNVAKNSGVITAPGNTPNSIANPNLSSGIKQPQAITNYQVIDDKATTQFAVDAKKVVTEGILPAGKISFDPDKMLTVLTNTRDYFQRSQDPKLALGGILSTQGVTAADTVKTLDFVIATLREDLQAKRPSRLQDPNFIRQNFRTIQWNAADPLKPEQRKIRITKYAVFTHPGSRTKTDKFDTAIYSLKDPRAKAATYTKQEVLAGIYEPGGKEATAGKVEPIAYLTRDGLEEALMEGTILIKFNDGSQGFFNVDRSNEISYIKGLDRKEQKRYWYFKPVAKIKGYGQSIDSKISIEPGVTFAGDVMNIGLGKLVVISSPDGMRMGTIADTGGAFLPNLHQLDFLAGTFDGKPAFDKVARSLPEYVTAYFLIKK